MAPCKAVFIIEWITMDKKVKMKNEMKQERYIQNACTPFPLLQKNNIFYIFQLATPINGLTVTGTVYTECVYTVPVATKEPYFLYFSVSHSN